MPTYLNSGTETIVIAQPRVLTLPPGVATESYFYLRELPENVTLTSHSPSTKAWTLISSTDSVPTEVINVASANNVVVFNATDNITVSANEDDDNAIIVQADTLTTFDNRNSLLGVIKVLTGTGTTLVWGSQLEMKFIYSSNSQPN